jgi:antitoxin HicB
MAGKRIETSAYPFTIRPLSEEEGGGYLIEFPGVPGCISDGETPEEAIRNGRDALKACLATMREFGASLPPRRRG